METTRPHARLIAASISVLLGLTCPRICRGYEQPTFITLNEAPAGAFRCEFLSTERLAGRAYSCLYVWDVRSGRRIIHRCGDPSAFVACSMDGRYLVAGRKIYGPKLELLQEMKLPDKADFVSSAAFSHNGALLALGLNRGRVIVVDAKTWQIIHQIVGPNPKMSALDVGFAASPTRLLVSWGLHETNSMVTAHELDSGDFQELSPQTRGTTRRVGNPFSDNVRAVCGDVFLTGDTPQFVMSPSGDTFALGVRTDDGCAALGLWDSRTLKPRWISNLGSGNVLAVAYSPDERYLIVGGYATHDFSAQTSIPLRAINSDNGTVIREIARRQDTPTTGIAFSRDGETVALSRLNAPIEFVAWKSIAARLK